MTDGDDDSGASASDDSVEPAESGGSAKWRCTWCGKPHERNDPPCDNCGHHKFEKAVVPAAPAVDDEYQREPVWVCPACGRQHQKNSPPCSRCGNANLERRIPDDEDFADELGGTSYVDVLEPQYVLGLAFAVVAGGALVLALLGVITLPGMGGDSLQVDDVPGEAETANGVALAEAETAYLDLLNERRVDAGYERLSRNDRLNEVALFANQRRVKAIYGDGTMPSNDRLSEAIGDSCGNERPYYVPLDRNVADSTSAFDSADALASMLVDAYLEDTDGQEAYALGRTGVDIHVAPDDRVFLTQFNC